MGFAGFILFSFSGGCDIERSKGWLSGWLAGWRACHRLELFSGTGNSRTENFLRFRFGKLAIFAWLLLVVVGDKNSSEKLLGRAQKSAPTSFANCFISDKVVQLTSPISPIRCRFAIAADRQLRGQAGVCIFGLSSLTPRFSVFSHSQVPQIGTFVPTLSLSYLRF